MTFPDRENAPSHATETASIQRVPRPVAMKLVFPITASCLGNSASAACVHVPEASGYENHGPKTGYNNVRRPWQIGVIQPMTVSETLDQPPNDDLRGGVSRTHRPHDSRPFSRREWVGHSNHLTRQWFDQKADLNTSGQSTVSPARKRHPQTHTSLAAQGR